MAKKTSTAFPEFKNEESAARYFAAYDAVLAAWPVPFEERDIATRLGLTHVIVSGPPDAPPLLLLPNFAGSATVWRLNIAGLSRHYRTYAVDVIGQPGKSVANQRIRTRRQVADWLNDLLDGLGIGRASMVGCSYGGFVALNHAVLAPERVDRIVAISPPGVFASQYWKLVYLMMIKAPLRQLLHRLKGGARIDPKTANAARFAAYRDKQWSALMTVMATERPTMCVTKTPAFTDAELRAIRAPTLLLIGEREVVYDANTALKHAQSRMLQLKGAIVPDADHIAAMAQPDDVNRRIVEFLH